MPAIVLTLIAIGALVAFYLPWLSGSADFFIKDTTHFFEPLCRFIGDGLAHGRLPLWNPYNYCGMSQAAISSPSMFYPLNWLFAAMPFSMALAWQLLLSQFVCALGMYLLIRSLGWSRAGAVVAAGAAGFCGYMFSLASNYTLVATACWLPLVLYCSTGCLRAERPIRFVIGNAAALAMMISAGRPEIGAPALVAAAGWCVLIAVDEAKRRQGDRAPEDRVEQTGRIVDLRTRVVDLVKSGVIGLLLAMPTILPCLEWLPWSRRSEGLPPQEVLIYSANWYDLLSMLLPSPLGHLQLRENPFSSLVIPGVYIPYYGSLFVGGIIIALAAMGMSKQGGKVFWAAIVALIITTIFALGSNVPGMSQLITVLPGASLLRFPSKLLFIDSLLLGAFAARGIELYLRGTVRIVPHIAAWLVCFCLGVMLIASHGIMFPFLAIDSINDAFLAQKLLALHVVAQAAMVVLFAGVMWLLERHDKRLLAVRIVAVVAIGSLLINAFANCRDGAPLGYFREPSFVVTGVGIKPDPPYRLTIASSDRFTVPDSYLSRVPLESTIKDFQYSRQLLKPFTNIDFRVPSAFGFEGAMVGEYYYFFLNMLVRSSQADDSPVQAENRSDVPFHRLMQLTASKYVLTQCQRLVLTANFHTAMQDIPLMDARFFKPVFEKRDRNVRVYEVVDPLPRAYFAASWKTMPRDDLIELMANPDPNALQIASTTLVENELGSQLPANGTLAPLAVQELSPEHLVVEADSQQSRLLVLQDQYYPGWKVRIDGAESMLLRCNAFMRGVVVPAGKHRVEFSFEPASVWASLLLFALGVLWSGVLWWQTSYPRRL